MNTAFSGHYSFIQSNIVVYMYIQCITKLVYKIIIDIP